MGGLLPSWAIGRIFEISASRPERLDEVSNLPNQVRTEGAGKQVLLVASQILS